MSDEDIHAILNKALHQRDLLADALTRAETSGDDDLSAKLQHALLHVEGLITLITSTVERH